MTEYLRSLRSTKLTNQQIDIQEFIYYFDFSVEFFYCCYKLERCYDSPFVFVLW